MRPTIDAPEAIIAAAQSGRIGEVIRLSREARGVTQRQLGELCQRDQSTISRIEREAYAPDMQTLRLVAERLDIPPALVGLADHPTSRSTAPPSEDPVKRREFLRAAALIAGSAIASTESDHSLAAIHTITNAQRRLDATTPSRDLAESVITHLKMTTRRHATTRDPFSQQSIAAALSEIAGYAAWLHWDMHDLGSARAYYNTAVRAARSTQDGTLHAYMLGSLATLAVYEGDAAEGLALLRRAYALVEPNPPAIATAWLSSLEAVAQADARNARRAWDALDRADDAVERTSVEEPPPWPWVFAFDHEKVARHRLTCAARLGRPEVAYSAVKSIGGFLQNGHAKQRALSQLDLATAYLHDHEVEEAFEFAAKAVQLGRQTQSGRVIDAARRFRRQFTGSPASPLVRSFDEHLYSASA